MTPLKNHRLNPFISIWFSPRATFRELKEKEQLPLLIAFAIASGAISAFTLLWLVWVKHPEKVLFKNIWIMALFALGGAVYGILYLYIGAWLYKVTGRWLKGKGEFREVRLALGWSFYPAIVGGILYLIAIILSQHIFLQFTFMLLSTIVGIWGFVLFLYLLSVAHEFSIPRAIVAVILAALLVIAFFFLLSLLFSLPLFWNKPI